MDTLTLTATERAVGKKAAKATRNAGLVPCVLYGPHTEPVHFSVETLALRPLFHTTETYRIAVDIGGQSLDAVLKEAVFHPVTERPWHVDFQALTAGEEMTMSIPVTVVGTAIGVREGGELSLPVHAVEVRGLPKDLPGHLDMDVSGLAVGDSFHVRDLTLPAGVTVLDDEDATLATVAMNTLGADVDEADAATAAGQSAESTAAAEAEAEAEADSE